MCEEHLRALGFSFIFLPPWERLQAGVSSHPDMLLFIYGKKFVTSCEYFEIAKEPLSSLISLGYEPILTDEIPSADYPHDILFNALPLGDNIIGLERGISKKLSQLGAKIVNVRQGYAKCSALKVSETAIITADRGIASAAKSCGADVLLISEGHINIDGYDHGFIGGAGGSDEHAVYFCGDLSSHPDGKSIEKFCKKHEKECISLGNEPLFDVGTLFFI